MVLMVKLLMQMWR